MAKINIHPSLSRFTQHQNQFELDIETPDMLIATLCTYYPLLKSTILSAQGDLIPYVNIYINGKHLKQCYAQQRLTQDDNIDVLTALVGG
ncbi:MoaD/ThiS family protein [bacterium]|nr:MoaD/ThiS family protein [bacterium]